VEESAETSEQDCTESELRMNRMSNTAASVKQSSHDVSHFEQGADAVGAQVYSTPALITTPNGCRRTGRRRNISSKVDLQELNMHSSLRSLYGARTDEDRRRPKDPCPCRVNGEDEAATEVGMDAEGKQAVPSEGHVQNGPPYTCDVCGKVLPDRQRLKRHMSMHPGDEPINCAICGRGFALLVHLNRHMKNHTTNQPYLCEECGACFAEKSFLDMHMLAHQPEDKKQTASAKTDAAEEMYRCVKCNETFSKAWRLRRHKTKMHRSRPALKPVSNSQSQCLICGKWLSYSLRVHMRIHTGERPYKCSTCGKSFYQRTSLRSHLSVHTGVKTHTCAECGKSFRLHGMLRQHMRMHHNNDLRHECPLCGKRFWVPTLLRDHLRLHTGEKPFQCSTCGRKYRLRKDMVKHERSHSSELTSRCEVCGFQTTNLKRHMMVHTGDKPFSCQHCGKDFRRKEHLRVHLSRLHNIELPKRTKVDPILLDSSLLQMQAENAEAINADECGLTLVIGDSVVVQ